MRRPMAILRYHLPDPIDSTYYPGAAVLDFLRGLTPPPTIILGMRSGQTLSKILLMVNWR